MKRIQIVSTIGVAGLILVACGSDDAGQADINPRIVAVDEAPDQQAEQDTQADTPSDAGTHPLDDESLHMTTEDDYVFITTMGAKGTLEFVEGDDPRVADLDNFLEQMAGIDAPDIFDNETADSWKYLVADVDNFGGFEDVDMRQVTLYDAQGATYTFTNAYRIIDESLALEQVAMDFFVHEESLYDEPYSITFDEYEEIRAFGYAVQDELPRSVTEQETGTFVLAMPADDVELPHDLDMVTVAAHGEFDEVYAYNVPMSEYEGWLPDEEYGMDWEMSE